MADHHERTETGRRRVIAQQWISVDGFASGASSEEEIFRHVSTESDEASMSHNIMLLSDVDAVVLGRRTYESFVGFWPTDRSRGVPVSPAVNAVPKVVASRTLREAPWGAYAPAQVVADPVSRVRELRSAPGGPVLVWGSLSLMGTLLGAGLIDELDLFVAPVALAGGTPLLPPGRPVHLRQVGGEILPDGGAHLRFEVLDSRRGSP